MYDHRRKFYLFPIALIKKHIKTEKMNISDVPAFASKALTLYGAAVWEVPEAEGQVRSSSLIIRALLMCCS
jgi:hypothetical protein